MIWSRRTLPSISSLRAFEAVGRLGSATAAARELSLTHGAISRQLKVLEEQMGTELILRDGPRLRLSRAGEEYCAIVRQVLNDLSRASLALMANPVGGSLNLAVLPAFATHWLAPRLRDFALRHPAITVNLSTRFVPFEFSAEPFDAAIHFGQRDWPGVEFMRIVGENVIAVCSPDLMNGPPERPEDLLAYPLLHLETRPDAWRNWFESVGVHAPDASGMLFDQFATMAQAASHGLGIALLPAYLAEAEIDRGSLMPAFDAPRVSTGSYYLVWPANRRLREPLTKFRNWLAEMAEAGPGAQG